MKDSYGALNIDLLNLLIPLLYSKLNIIFTTFIITNIFFLILEILVLISLRNITLSISLNLILLNLVNILNVNEYDLYLLHLLLFLYHLHHIFVLLILLFLVVYLILKHCLYILLQILNVETSAEYLKKKEKVIFMKKSLF